MTWWTFWHREKGFHPIPQLFATERDAKEWAVIWSPEYFAPGWEIRKVKLVQC